MASNRDSIKVNFLGDTSHLAREARKAQGVVTQTASVAERAGARMGKAFAFGIAGASAAGVALAKSSIDAASALNESTSKNAQVFRGHAKTVESWAKDNRKNILLSNQAAIEGAATFGNLFVALGIGTGPAAKLSTSLVGLASDLSSFNNTPVDEALLALRSGLLGEAEPLRKFGVSLSAARIEAEAYALGLAKPVKNAAAIASANIKVAAAQAKVTDVEKKHGKGTLAAAQARDALAKAEGGLEKATAGSKAELTAAQKAQAAYSIVMKDTAVAQGDAARTADGYANSQKILAKRFDDLRAELGQKLLPIALDVTQAVSDLVLEFQNGTGTGGEIRDAMADLAEKCKAVYDTLVPLVQFVADHSEVFGTLAVGVGSYAAAMKAAAIASELMGMNGPLAVDGIAAAGNSAKGNTGKVAAFAAALGRAAGAAGLLAGLYLMDEKDGPIKGTLNQIGGGFKQVGSGVKNNSNGEFFGGVKDIFLGDLPFGGKPKATSKPARSGDDSRPRLTPMPRSGDDRRQKLALAPGADAMALAQKQAAAQAKAGQYAADGLGAYNKKIATAAKAREDAARKLEEASERMAQALEDRRDHAKGIRDSLVSSNSVLVAGVSWTSKDLLASFKQKMEQVKRFSTLISTMVHKGYSNTIVQQVAQAGVDGGMATAQALASANAQQVGQFNSVQTSISKAAGRAGDRAALSQYGPVVVNLVLGGKTIQTITAEVNRENKRNAANGSTLAPL